uniref:Small integral membrane protein 15 n=1 Tax=Urocitellus parryii TaxID=9999 RepID=A0A8D2HGS2_UROPR
MFDIKAWAEYIVEWAAKDPYGFLTTVILALTPLFLASAVLPSTRFYNIYVCLRRRHKAENIVKFGILKKFHLLSP